MPAQSCALASAKRSVSGCTGFRSGSQLLSAPTSATSADVALVGALRSWDPDLKPVHPETDLFALARAHDCAGIALSWGLDELSEKAPLKGDLPVFYPLIGMTKDEVGALRERIGR